MTARRKDELAAVPQVGRFLFRGKGRRGAAARAALGRVLDFEFERSALPALPEDVLAAGPGYLVGVPAPRWLGWGNQSHLGLVYLVLLARLVDARRVLEIGTYNGLTSLVL